MYSARPNNDQEETLATKRQEREKEKRESFLEVGFNTLNNFLASNFSPMRKQRYLWGKFHSLLRTLSWLLLFERERDHARKNEVCGICGETQSQRSDEEQQHHERWWCRW
jgi:hypothetical protein